MGYERSNRNELPDCPVGGRQRYVLPCTEVCAAEGSESLLLASMYGDAGSGSFENSFDGGGGSAGAANLTGGAKAVDILGTEFSFSDVWDD